VDLVSLARSVERHEFIAECPFPLLLSVNEPVDTPPGELFADDLVTQSNLRPTPAPETQPVKKLVLYPVRKVHSLLPHGIVLGRIASCDIVIVDRHVSKAHALFQESNGGWSISDIGSHNGTHVKHQKVMPRGAAVPVSYGDIVSFAFRTFYFLDAGSAWDKARLPR
jgi:hypothetical protein